MTYRSACRNIFAFLVSNNSAFIPVILFSWLSSQQSYIWIKVNSLHAPSLLELTTLMKSFPCSLPFAPSWLIKALKEELSYIYHI